MDKGKVIKLAIAGVVFLIAAIVVLRQLGVFGGKEPVTVGAESTKVEPLPVVKPRD